MNILFTLVSKFWAILLIVLIMALILYLIKVLFDSLLEDTEIGRKIVLYFKRRAEIRKQNLNVPKINLKFNNFITYYALKPSSWCLKEKEYIGDYQYKYRFNGIDNIKYFFFVLDLKKQKKLLNAKKSEENFYECLKKDFENYKSKI